MKKVLIGCSGALHIAKKIANYANCQYSALQIKKFPDSEIDMRFMKDVKGREVILVQSFYGNVNEKIVETLFAGYTAKDLGAEKVTLIALYFPYLRKDKQFKKGECVSAKVMGRLFSIFDRVYAVEPHLHRVGNLSAFIKRGKKISVTREIADFIRKLKIKDIVFFGPDSESKQWVEKVSREFNEKCHVLEKKRHSSRKVSVKLERKLDLKGKTVFVIDDIISTGGTMIETVRKIKRFNPARIYCIAVHGIFAENALEKLKKLSVRVITANTIPSKVSKIDISKTIAKAIKCQNSN